MKGGDYPVGKGNILIVGRDYGYNEKQQGRPFVGRAGKVLDRCLQTAGIFRKRVNITNVVNMQPPKNNWYAHPLDRIEQGIAQLKADIKRLQPSVIVTLGNEASGALIESWPGDSMKQKSGIEDRRGYVYEYEGIPVVPSIHPAAVDRQWVPWAAYLTEDLKRAKRIHEEGFARPQRDVTVAVTPAEVEAAVKAIESAELVACDIEITQDQELLCVGFATSASQAYVFPYPAFDDAVRALVEGPTPKVFANGQFDIHFLRTRTGWEVGGYAHDTQLAWHSCYPELAGKSEIKNHRMTRKSLSFLASMFLDDAWWKDYDTDEEGMYILNGKDCCITLDIMVNHLLPLLDEQRTWEIYEHELALVPLCVAAQQRGLLVDEERRASREEELDARWNALASELGDLVLVPLTEALEGGNAQVRDGWHLFEEKWTCPCCRNGSAKREHCTTCAGVVGTGKGGAVKVADLRRWMETKTFHHIGNEDKLTKAQLTELLPQCEVCDGEGQRITHVFNPNSDAQKRLVLYYVLKLPKKYKDGALSCAEDKLKSNLAYARMKGKDVAVEVLLRLIETQRIKTMRGIYAGLAPGPDGCIRTVMSPSGTETGRLSHGSTFLEPSRNLANMPKKTAGLDELFDVRSVFIPRPGMVFMEADYSQVEARIAACMANDPTAIRQYEEGVDRYRWFASKLYDCKMEEVSKEQRHVGKTAVLALQYGVGWKTFMEHVNGDEELTGASITAADAKRAVDLFHQLYPGYARWHAEVAETERRQGHLRNAFGRRRDFFARRDSEGAFEAVRREMVAFLPQSTAVDLMNHRAREVFNECDPLGEKGRDWAHFLLQIHDAILVEVRKQYADVMAHRLKGLLEFPLNIKGRELLVPSEVSISSISWAKMREVL